MDVCIQSSSLYTHTVVIVLKAKGGNKDKDPLHFYTYKKIQRMKPIYYSNFTILLLKIIIPQVSC